MAIEHREKRRALGLSGEDFIVFWHDFDNVAKRVVNFCVIQFYGFCGKNFEVVRFDTSHGFCHVHRFYRGVIFKETLPREICSATYIECKNEILENWQEYKKQYLMRQRF